MGTRRTSRPHFLLTSSFFLLTCPAFSQAPYGQPVVEIVLEQEGQRFEDPLVRGLIETAIGEPLSMRDVRESIDHLMNLRRFEDVRPVAEPVASGVRLRYVLVPTHPVDRVEFTGSLGLDEDDLRDIVTDRFGDAPSAARIDEIVAALRQAYTDRGYPAARITPRIEETHDPDRATMIVEIASGQQAIISEVQIVASVAEEQNALTDVPRIEAGRPYDRELVEQELQRWEDRMHELGYYEARASHGVSFPPNEAFVRITVLRGPRVVLQFTGDPLPSDEQERLVPIRTEGSADEDLLEDAQRNIEDFLQAQGYRDASAPYTPQETIGELIITFHVTRGPRYVVDSIAASGNTALTADEIDELLAIRRGEVFVQSVLQARAETIENIYRSRGFTKAQVTTLAPVLPSEGPPNRDRRVEVRLTIAEGPRTTVGQVAFDGHMALTDGQLRALVPPVPGAPYSEAGMAAGREAILLEYRNRGYETVAVRAESTLSADAARADIRYVVQEGQQSLIDHIIVVGNDRTGTDTITGALRLFEGGPLGYTALLESRAALAALGLFRRVDIQPLQHAGEARRDVLIIVEEADPTVLDLGGGIEGGFRGREGAGGQIEEQLFFAPRGFVTIGRRNFWGKNRAATLFTRVSLRSTDVVVSEEGVDIERETDSSLGFNEYRVVATFSEPRAFSTPADVLITGIAEQAVRTSFDFSRKILRAETGRRLTQAFSFTARYSFEKTRLFNQRFTERDPLIDRLFPQVRLSRVAGSLIRDTRDSGLDPSRGTWFSIDGDLAMRAIGSEVGFARTFVQAFTFRQLPTPRRLVLGLAGRLGVARGFEREVDTGGTVAELPASERFFAGGDSSVRGFTLDRLGNEFTINPETGFPSGGNGIIVVNGELRASVTSRWQAVGFLDAGNVFLRASEIDLTDLRPAAGVGVRYFSSLIGAVRVDLGFNLDRRELRPGEPERQTVFHVSFGQAF